MGLEVISFTIKEVRDKNEYISNMGRPDIARVNRDVEKRRQRPRGTRR
jgi:flotillin